MTRASLALLFVAVTALPAGAAALPEGSEICRFRALNPDNPFRRWLASQDVTCVAAGAPVSFPSGLWNVFARGEGKVSASPVLIDGDAEPASIDPPLVPGATITPLLPEGQRGVVYVPRRGSAFPVDGSHVTVPADEPLWLLVIDAVAQLDQVIPIAAIAPGAERQVDARSGAPAAVIGWLQVPEDDRAALAAATGVTSPAIRTGSRDADPLPPPELLHGAFFRITGVPDGTTELRVEGRGWVPTRGVVRVQRGISVAAAPLSIRAAGTLTVHWSIEQDLSALERSVGACGEADRAPQLTIAISKCAQPRRGAVDPADCALIRAEKVDGVLGSVTFDDIVPGLYRAEMRFGKLPPASGTASVAPLRVADLRLSPDYLTVYGSVTRGGEPLGEDVRIGFSGGVGFAPADTEEYRAVFRPPPLAEEAQIEVIACDGSLRAVVVTDQPMRAGARFDIDIPPNELTVQVSDTFTREPLPGATVKLEAMEVLHRVRVAFTTTDEAGREGNVVWTGVPVREIHIKVSHAGYDTRTVEPFTMEKREERTVDVQLVPLRGTRGKIVSERPFDRAIVTWYSPAGHETERADIAADGTFVYANRHTSEETMAVVSASHPLWVLRAPAAEGRESLSLRFPTAPVAAFDVWIAAAVRPKEPRPIGIAIGGVGVPQAMIEEHQDLRDDPHLLRGFGPLHFRDLLATGPIDVLIGDARQRVPPGAKEVVVRVDGE